jgi:hypothetical protein
MSTAEAGKQRLTNWQTIKEKVFAKGRRCDGERGEGQVL